VNRFRLIIPASPAMAVRLVFDAHPDTQIVHATRLSDATRDADPVQLLLDAIRGQRALLDRAEIDLRAGTVHVQDYRLALAAVQRAYPKPAAAPCT
jgi:hypothetical protein